MLAPTPYRKRIKAFGWEKAGPRSSSFVAALFRRTSGARGLEVALTPWAPDCRTAMARKASSKPEAYGELIKVAPGMYVDLLGGEYFYLTGMYLLVSKSMASHGLRRPASVAMIFDELRRGLEEHYCTELMD